MNKLIIIGNLTRDPELRTTTSGVDVCSFTVAVNKRKAQGEEEADFFRVSAWRERAKICAQYLQKGKKVCVIGAVTMRTYTDSNGITKANMEVTADEVEFLSARSESYDKQTGYAKVAPQENPFEQQSMDELPWDQP